MNADLCRIIRECIQDYHYKDIVIPAKSMVMIPSFLLHKDPNYWEDPEKFDPLRYWCSVYCVQDNFSVRSACRFTDKEKTKRPQLCYCPFGSGPRNCIGVRFAILEIKLALIELMKKFTFIKAPDTEVIF